MTEVAPGILCPWQGIHCFKIQYVYPTCDSPRFRKCNRIRFSLFILLFCYWKSEWWPDIYYLKRQPKTQVSCKPVADWWWPGWPTFLFSSQFIFNLWVYHWDTVEDARWNSWRTSQGLLYRICCVCDGCDSDPRQTFSSAASPYGCYVDACLLWHCVPSWGWLMSHSEPLGEGVRLISHQNTLQDTHKACWFYNNCMTNGPHSISEV